MRRAVIALVALAVCVHCGPSARQKALSGALLSVNVARDGFIAWDDAHQGGIVDACRADPACTPELAHERLNAYRGDRSTVVDLFDVAYRGLAVAAIDGATPLPTILTAIEELAGAVSALEKGAP